MSNWWFDRLSESQEKEIDAAWDTVTDQEWVKVNENWRKREFKKHVRFIRNLRRS